MRESWDPFAEGTILWTCGPDCALRLSEIWREEHRRAGSSIVNAEDTDRDVYFVLAGKVRAASYTHSGKEVRFSDLPPGESFGIFAALDGLPRSTNIIAPVDCLIARMSAEAFEAVLDEDRAIRRAILLYMVSRVRALSEQITKITALTAAQRLIVDLLDRAEIDDEDRNSARVTDLPTHDELAILTFSQREAVTSHLGKLRKAGLIESTEEGYVIPDLDALRARLPD